MIAALLTSAFLAMSGLAGASELRAPLPVGSFRPLFGSEGQDLPVKEFWLDRAAVTNAQFEKFVKQNKEWRRGKVPAELADENYLQHWKRRKGGFEPKGSDRRKTVVQVSWFAAQEFCQSLGGRLPSTLEWEYAAAASRDKADASKDPAFQEKILQWYSTRGVKKGSAGEEEANFYGVRGLHGQIWEWTSDFNAFFVAGDNRQDGDQSKNFFCGAGATGAENREAYATFMRYALRSSLQASFTLNSMGFRCAYDHE